MPVPEFEPPMKPYPELHHLGLKTTFCGVQHKTSTPEAPVHQYLGIKYATFPARFRQSHLWTTYPTVTDASAHGPICPQTQTTKSSEELLFGVPREDIPVQHLEQDEFDCLNLNITCPADLKPHSRIPVMLWIHGGGDRGSGSNWIYDGGNIVRKSIAFKKPVILVTINFRLGLLGFAASPLIREDNKVHGEEGTGNYGLRDQRVAMEWVHNYIGDFGGDPNNVTLFGAASGAADIVCHLLSRDNERRPLFHRAIIQSPVFEPIVPDVSNAGWHLSRVMSALQISSIDKFRSIAVEKLVGLGQTNRALDDGVFFRDGWQSYFNVESAHTRHHHREHSRPLGRSLHPPVSTPRVRSRSRSRSALRGLRSPSRSHATFGDLMVHGDLQPLIIGDSACDSLLWSIPISLWTSAGVVRRIKAICQSLSKTSGILRAYDISSYTPDDEIMEKVLELVNDARVAWPTHCLAENAKQERGGRNVWRYVFDQEGPSRGLPHHAADLMYLFDNAPLPQQATDDTPEADMFYDGPFDVSDDEDDGPCSTMKQDFVTLRTEEDEWMTATVDEYSYARVRDATQERWLTFAHGEAPWREDKFFVFGPEGETGERSKEIFEGRRRQQMWKEALEPLGAQLVQKFGVELSRGPALGADRVHV